MRDPLTPAKIKGFAPQFSEEILTRFEFHRRASALLPEAGDRDPGVAVMVDDERPGLDSFTCNCAKSCKSTCSHARMLAAVNHYFRSLPGDKTLEQDFRESVWHHMATALAEGSPDTPASVRSELGSENGRSILKVYGSGNDVLLTYVSAGADRTRFADRCLAAPNQGKSPSRAGVLSQLALWTLTDNERGMAQKGFKTRRQVLEEKFWYRLAYHAYRELGAHNIALDTFIDTGRGVFVLNAYDIGGHPVFHLTVPRTRVKALLECLQDFQQLYYGMEIHPLALITVFKISRIQKREPALEVTPYLQLTQPNGEIRLWAEGSLDKFRFGDLVYLADENILAEHRKPRWLPEAFKTLSSGITIVKKNDIPAFLDTFDADFSKGSFLRDDSARSLNIFKRPDHIHITPDTLERDWCWLSVAYGFGNSEVSLSEILRARAEGRRYIETADGWLDAQAPGFEELDRLAKSREVDGPESHRSRMKISRLDLLRLQAATSQKMIIEGRKTLAQRLERMLNFKPGQPFPEIRGMTSSLRAYQRAGAEWISFLYENGFGGLLCDDMGLGKTHEVMAFMVYLRKRRRIKKPFLVVCPTTVLSHWHAKIRDHAPGLKAIIYHGSLRDIDQALETADVLLTSYGVLRRDIRALQKRAFGLVVFDEIQHIKNRLTQSYVAASRIRSRMKLGLTGTPIENTVFELKALMDLVIAGYLGSDDAFKTRYIDAIEAHLKTPRRNELSRVISPFTLRRLKTTVLDELPPKIEDIRTCRLSEDQVKLYRDAVSNQGRELIRLLRMDANAVPYLHIFALLTLLKQICNHPATVSGGDENYSRYQSGKWELFKELLSEALDSGQKVVVYSQFLNMIRIMENHLTQSGVNFATLTGASRNRGKIIDRFNNNPGCRVFVGSLKAGGTGIDLVSASVVIHYDRWWNAAREDQATDRVHRIGQKRGVQVFKLVTEGTLEEKISAIIERKKNLMNRIVKEDDPGLLKSFSRLQLIDLLAVPR